MQGPGVLGLDDVPLEHVRPLGGHPMTGTERSGFTAARRCAYMYPVALAIATYIAITYQYWWVGILHSRGLARLRAARLGRRGAQGRGGAHEGRHARGWGHPNPWRQRLRATPSGDELSHVNSR